VQALPISLATTLGISVDFFSCSYLDVSVRRVRFAYLCIQYAMTQRAGFPHSEICGSKRVCSLPAAYRKLLRPSSPVIAKASTMCTYSLVPITLASALLYNCSCADQKPVIRGTTMSFVCRIQSVIAFGFTPGRCKTLLRTL
jgi:hypothetical protein